MANALPWTCWQGGIKQGSRSTRLAAQRLVEHPWRPGNAMVRNTTTGEEWHRRYGTWVKLQDHWPQKDQAS